MINLSRHALLIDLLLLGLTKTEIKMMANQSTPRQSEIRIRSIWKGNTQEKGTREEENIQLPDLYFLNILIRN
jgi:hypothetical protein